LKKVYTPVGIVFKGSGFYATDHRSPSGVTHSSSTKHEDSKGTEKAETKAEAKAETKAEKSSTAESASTHNGDKA